MHGRTLAFLAVVIVALGAFALTRPHIAVSPASAGAPISADGFSRFTPNGHKYFTEHGEILIALDHPARPLALPIYGASKFAPVPPIKVSVLHEGTTDTVEDVAEVLIFTHEDRVITVKLTKSDGEVVEFRSENDPSSP
jgi:hypothetical protein